MEIWKILCRGTWFASSSFFTQISGIIHRGKIRVQSNPLKRYQSIKTSIAKSKAQSQYLQHNHKWTIWQILLMLILHMFSAANKYYSSTCHHARKNKKTTGQIKFSAVTIKQGIKLVLRHSLCKNEFNVLVQELPLHSFIYSISCLVK